MPKEVLEQEKNPPRNQFKTQSCPLTKSVPNQATENKHCFFRWCQKTVRCFETSWRGWNILFLRGDETQPHTLQLGCLPTPTFRIFAILIVWAQVRYTRWGFWIYLQGNQHNTQLIFRIWLIQKPAPYSNYIHWSPAWVGFCLNAYGVNWSSRFTEAAERLVLWW